MASTERPRALAVAVVVGVAALVAFTSLALGAFATTTTTDGPSSPEPDASTGSSALDVNAPDASRAMTDNDTTAVVARYPAANGSMVERVAFAPQDVAFVGAPVNDSRTGLWRVPMRLTDGGADRFVATVDAAGFTGEAGSCPRTDGRNDQGRCLLVLVDGDVAASFGVGPALLQAVASGDFEANPQFVLAAETESEALAVWRAFQNDTVPPTADTTSTGDADGTATSDAATNTATDSGTTTDSDTATDSDEGFETTTRPPATTVTDTDPVVAGTTSESSGTPGFGVLAAGLALVALVAVSAARRHAT